MTIKASCEVVFEIQLDVDFSFSPGVAASYSSPAEGPEIEVEDITAYYLISRWDTKLRKTTWDKVAIPKLTPEQVAFFSALAATQEECNSQGEAQWNEEPSND